MKSIKLTIAIVTLFLLSSCNMVAQDINPTSNTPNDYNFVYIKYTGNSIRDIRNGMTDSKKCYQDADAPDQSGIRIADLLNGGKPNNSTVKTNYILEMYLLDAAPCDGAGNMLINPSTNRPYQVWIAVDNAGLKRLETLDGDYSAKIGVVSVQKSSTWYTNSANTKTGVMQTSTDYGTYYTY